MLRLFVNWYNEKDEYRKGELLFCLIRNMEIFDEVINVSDENTPLFGDRVVWLPKGKRATFTDFFAAVDKYATHEDISVVSNLDIYFDETIRLVSNMEYDDVLALTRWDIKNGEPVFFNRIDSQDTWVVRGKPKKIVADWTMGVGGCDNALAHVLSSAGYSVTNPSLSIKTYHLHANNNFKWRNQKAIPPPYLVLPITDFKTKTTA